MTSKEAKKALDRLQSALKDGKEPSPADAIIVLSGVVMNIARIADSLERIANNQCGDPD